MSFIQRQFVVLATIASMLAMIFGYQVMPAGAVSPSNFITYQGRVLDANGVPVSSASLAMKFFLYTASVGGTCVWSNSSGTCHSNTPATTTARTVTLTSGLFTENLGDTTLATPYAAIADSTFADNASLYLAVEIAGETLSPRKLLTAAPYAMNADTLDGIDSALLQLFEVGTNGSYEDDAAVIVGTDAVFSYANGGTGDLRVADQLEVIGNTTLAGTMTLVGSEGTTYLTLSAGDAVISDGSLSVTDDDNARSINANNNTATTIGAGGVGNDAVYFLGSSSLTTGNLLQLSANETNLTGDYLTAYDIVGNQDVFRIREQGAVTAAAGNFTVSAAGDIVTAGDLAINGDDLTADGDLTINPAGGDIIFPNTVTFNIGGNGSDVTYNVFGDSTAGASASMDSDDDLYIEGNLEVDGGTIRFDSAGTATFILGSVQTRFDDSDGNMLMDINDVGTSGDVRITGNLQVRGGALTTNQTTFNLLNTTATTLNIGGAATTLSLGAGTGTTTVNNNLAVTGISTFTGAASFDGGANPANAGVEVLGTTALEWDGLYIGDDGVGVTFGAAQNVVVNFDTTTVALEMVGGLISIGADPGGATATASGDLLVSDALEVDGATDLDGALSVAGTTTFTGALDADGDVSIADTNIAFDGASTTFSVTGAFTLNPGSTLSLGDGADALNINATAVNATSTTFDLDATGVITVTSTVATGNGITLDTTDSGIALTVAGAEAGEDLTLTSNRHIILTSSVANATAITLTTSNAAGGFDINAGSGGLDVDSTGVMSFDGGLVVVGGAAGGNTATGDADLYVLDALEVDGATDLDGALSVANNTTLDGDLAVNGDDITSDGNLSLSATGYVRIGDTTIPGNATADDDLFVQNALEVDGLIYLDGQVQTTESFISTLNAVESFRVDIDGTGTFSVRENSGDIFSIDGSGNVAFTMDAVDNPAYL
ncbi:hypothetical protein FJZ23_02700, partial [Candidatus Parcubacteria bacterium]|nr:hypothetical protein [Candidatus Parcubacteria bacterium]